LTNISEKDDKPVSDKLDDLKTFISRRFDEISMEINATSQMIDMTENSLGQKFVEILSVLNAVGNSEGGITSSNSGFELDMVVDQTEKAANDIMDSADAIDKLLKSNIDFSDEEMRNQWFIDMSNNIEKIMLACSFQDLTGQRINKAVKNIRDAEDRLQNVLNEIGVNVSDVRNLSKDLIAPRIASQDDIDAMFTAAKKNLERR